MECVYLSHRSRQLTDLLSVRLQRVLHGILSARIILNMRRVASDSLAPGWLDLNIGRSNHSSGVTPVHTQRSDIDIQMDIFKSEFIRNWIHSTFIITERCWALRPWQLTDVDVTEFGNFGCLPVLYYFTISIDKNFQLRNDEVRSIIVYWKLIHGQTSYPLAPKFYRSK